MVWVAMKLHVPHTIPFDTPSTIWRLAVEEVYEDGRHQHDSR